LKTHELGESINNAKVVLTMLQNWLWFYYN